jgi:hypothetical protein
MAIHSFRSSLLSSLCRAVTLAIDFAAGCKNIPVICFYEKVPQTYGSRTAGILGKFAKFAVCILSDFESC